MRAGGKGRRKAKGQAIGVAEFCKAQSLPVPEPEFWFWPGRRFRFDYAWPSLKVALEIEGGTYKFGRHNRPEGYEDDCRKYSEASLRGWLLVRCTTRMCASGEIWTLLERALSARLMELRGGG